MVPLHFAAVDCEATVWVDGQEVGFHRGGHAPFETNAGLALGEGENRVVDRQDPGQPHGIDSWCATGIWEGVWLEPAGDALEAKVVELMVGFCDTQLTDIEQERNGLLTDDRRPKVDVEAVAAAIRTVGT